MIDIANFALLLLENGEVASEIGKTYSSIDFTQHIGFANNIVTTVFP